MGELIESYKIGNIAVQITGTDHPNRLKVECNDGIYRSSFTVSEYEFKHYKRHMNQKIKNAFKAGHGD